MAQYKPCPGLSPHRSPLTKPIHLTTFCCKYLYAKFWEMMFLGASLSQWWMELEEKALLPWSSSEAVPKSALHHFPHILSGIETQLPTVVIHPLTHPFNDFFLDLIPNSYLDSPLKINGLNYFFSCPLLLCEVNQRGRGTSQWMEIW